MFIRIGIFLLLFVSVLALPWLGYISGELTVLRYTRVGMAFFGGGGIVLSTFILQNLTRNPLTSEYTLGISAAVSFFAALSYVLGLSPVLGSLLGGAGVTFLLFVLLRKKLSGTLLILLGIILNIFFAAGITFLNYLTSFKVSQALERWIFGGLSFYSFGEVALVAAFALAVFLYGMAIMPPLTLVSIAEIYETLLGRRFRMQAQGLLLLIGMFISLVTTYTGPIPFMGLLLANFMRFSLKGRPLASFMLSFLSGGCLLAWLDTLLRLLRPLEEMPLGIVIGLLGLPFLVVLLLTERQRVG